MTKVIGYEAIQGDLGLLTMGELAKYVGRHPQIVRRYFAEGLLPEPAYRIKHARKTTRKFTLQEAEAVKREFDNVHWGTFAKRRRRLA